MTRNDVKQQVDVLLDKYEALEGLPRTQTHRDGYAIATMELLLRWRREQAAVQKNLFPETAAAQVPKRWPVLRVKNTKWNGLCRRCGKKAGVGHMVAWDPASGRPSVWQHLDCANPFGGRR